MKVREKNNLLLLLFVHFFAGYLFIFGQQCLVGFGANTLSYDYTATIECLANPHKPQYGGGIIINPELNKGLKRWSTFGNSKTEIRESKGNKFIVAHSRNQPNDSFSQSIYLQKNKLYVFSAWIQVGDGSAPVTAVFQTSTGLKHAGSVIAESNCWSLLKGGLTVDASGPAELYFESNNTSVEIWVDSVSLQPFTEEQWSSHQDQRIEMTRKRKVKIQAVDKQGNPLANAKISIEQKISSFPFGCAINKNILTNTAYQNWFTSRFKVTTFENEMKWYSTEVSQGKVDYSVPDAMLKFAKQHNIAVRGHNVFWDDPQYQQGWLKSLSPTQLLSAAKNRLGSIMTRYKGQVIAWDVVNENLHFSFFESKLGNTASSTFYNWAFMADSRTTMFMNDYNTIEDSRDGLATPARYLQKLREIQKNTTAANNRRIGIGLESHFSSPPNIPYIRASIDTLAATGFPIWLTEVDVQSNLNQSQYLEQILREAHSHPKVSGIVIWAAWSPGGCDRMCLTDNNFKNLATGNVVDKLLREWGLKHLAGTTDMEGSFEASLFHGSYEVKISHPALTNSSLAQNLIVAPTDASQQTTLLLQASA